MLTIEEKIDTGNANRMKTEVGLYHANQAVEEYNNGIRAYDLAEVKDTGEEKLIIHLKRAIPHLVECRKLGYQDSRMSMILNGIQHILSHGKPINLDLLRL